MLPLFFHGLPGSPKDAELLAFKTEAFDYLNQCANWERPRDVVAFSLGAMPALRIAAARPDMMRSLTLVSAAAPLHLGRFLPDMAGKPVFSAARFPMAFAALTALQSGLVKIAPELMLEKLFAKCGKAEKDLLSDKATRAVLLAGLSYTYLQHPRNYRKHVQEYVSKWGHDLDRISVPVAIWHGTADTWAPPAMAKALAARIPNATLHLIERAEHYSALSQVRPYQ